LPSIAVPFIGTISTGVKPGRWRVLLPILRTLAMVLLVVALARPQALGVPMVATSDAIDVMFVLDVSSSMASQDFERSTRLDAARTVIGRFIDGRAGDRLGLITFARQATLLCPITIDHDVLRYQLQAANLAEGRDDGTAIGLAVASAVNHLRRSPARSRVVILVTDGENNRSTIEPETGAEIARALGVVVHTIGVGRAAKQDTGATAHELEAIATIANGTFHRAPDPETLRQVFSLLDRLERSPVATRLHTRVEELFVWLVALALLLFASELVLRHTVLRRLP
jgi:Ca-activated chloride channel family protein